MKSNYRCRSCGLVFDEPTKKEQPGPCGVTTTCHCPKCGSMDLEDVRKYMGIDLDDDEENYILVRQAKGRADVHLHAPAADLVRLACCAVEAVAQRSAILTDPISTEVGMIKLMAHAIANGVRSAEGKRA